MKWSAMAEWSLPVGESVWRVRVPEDRVLQTPPGPPGSAGPPRELVAESLEHPLDFEPLRRALTPDDHICIVLDERLPHLPELIAGVLDHLVAAGVDPDAVTLVSPDAESRQRWIDELPDEFADVKAERHCPTNRKSLSYLASTKAGERIYLNRTVGEADFVIVLCLQRHGDSGESLLVPGLCDLDYQKRTAGLDAFDNREIIWLLGTPFFVRIIEGVNGTVHAVLSGLTATQDEAAKRQQQAWTRPIRQQPDTVLIAPNVATFTELCDALAHAERVVAPGGRIVAVLRERPEFPPAMDLLRQSGDAETAAALLHSQHPAGWIDARRWADFSSHAALYFAGPLTGDECEELYGTAIASETELQRLLDGGSKVLFLADAHLNRLEYTAKGKP